MGPFCWAEGRFSVRLNAPTRFLLLDACYYGERGSLQIAGGNSLCTRIEIGRGWKRYSVDLGTAQTGTLRFELDKVIPVKEDSRELGLMLRRLEGFSCPQRFRELEAQIRNAELNERERLAGETTLRSVPPKLRITIEKRCNISPRCVYCEWDWAKSLEAKNDLDFSLDTLRNLGDFYNHAMEIVDCSYGEPFLNRDLKDLVDDFDRQAKHFEMTSNGQVMSREKIDMLLGKSVIVYFSLDAANAESYRRYRNDEFETLVTNVREICRRKKQHGGRPSVIVSFIAMKSNFREFPEFIDLVADLGVDAVKLRSLYHEGAMLKEEVQRAGYAFRYRDEVLDLETLRDFIVAARETADRKGIPLFVDVDDFQPTESEGPLCSEPWETLYLLNRGIMPCCFGKKPLATLDGVAPGELGSFVAETFNGPAYRELRKGLAAGELPRYCREAKSCPIVKKVMGA